MAYALASFPSAEFDFKLPTLSISTFNQWSSIMRTPVSSVKLLAMFACCLMGRTLSAQDEPIAVAKPAAAAKSTAAGAVASSEKKLRPLTINVQLTSTDTKIVGTLTETTQLLLKTAFGEANIPLSEVAGIRFPTGDDSSTTIVMLNGDSITGASDVKFVTVETEWGVAKINGDSVTSMLFVPGLNWQQGNSINGKRWALVEAKPANSTVPGVAGGNPNLPRGLNSVSGSQPGRNQSNSSQSNSGQPLGQPFGQPISGQPF